MKPLLTWIAATASLLGLVFTLMPASSALSLRQVLLIVLVSTIYLAAAFFDIRDERKKAAKKYHNKLDINNYMYNMLKNSGACEICSRDASWISERRIMALLEEKAKNRELTFLVHQKTEELKRLEQFGAVIIEYGKMGFNPLTRFTIANSGNKNSSYVAIGRQKPNEPHIIEELDYSHPTYSMAADLIQALRVTHALSAKK